MDIMGLLTASTILLSVGVNDQARYSYDYNYLDDNGIVSRASGDHFFRPNIPVFTFGGITKINDYGAQWNFNTPFSSRKYDKGTDVQITFFKEIRRTKSSKFRASLTLSSMGSEKIRSCSDSLHREFHCFYGTQEGHPYFVRSFDEIQEGAYHKYRSFDFQSFAIDWILTF